MREDGLSQCGRSILMSTGIAPPTETQAGGATCAHSTTIGEEGVACNFCTLRDPSPSLQSKLHQYPARTLNQFVLPLQSTIHTSNYSCSPRREMPIIHRVCPVVCPRPQPLTAHPQAYSTRHVILPLDTAVVMPLARSLVSPVTTASGRKVACRVACPEPTTAMRAETVAVPVQHTIDALVADQPLSRFQSPGRCPALFAGV